MVKRRFDYEKEYSAVKDKITELRELAETMKFDLSDEIKELENKMVSLREQKYQNLTPWEKILISRHSERPTALDFINYLCEEWIELHGDRIYADDPAIVGGIALFRGIPITIVGHQKGKKPQENMRRNYGMPNPEGYRKVHRLLRQAEKFKRPVVTIVNTPGAYPGVGAEERGQALVIAQSLMMLSDLRVPIISVVTGEGGSGGALALAVSDRLIMFSNTVFSVASAEACTSILCKNGEKDIDEMAAGMKLTAQDLQDLKITDEIIEEPIGGIHLDFTASAEKLGESIERYLKELSEKDVSKLVEERYTKLRNIGIFRE